jgi:hypothetical protein
MSTFTYVLAGVACFLISVMSFIVYKYSRLRKLKGSEMSKEDVLGRLFMKKIENIASLKNGTDEVFRKLNKVMKNYFRELFEIEYEFDYLELNEELGKKGIDEELRKYVIDFTMKLSEAEYSGKKLTQAELSSIIEKSKRVVINIMTKGRSFKAPEEKEPVKPVMEAHEPVAAPETAVRDKKPAQAVEKAPPEKVERKPKKKEKEKPYKTPAAAKEPSSPEERVSSIRRLLIEAEESLRQKRYEDAMDGYTELKGMYDSVSREEKMGMMEEARRIIGLYNTLLTEYKDMLSVKPKEEK